MISIIITGFLHLFDHKKPIERCLGRATLFGGWAQKLGQNELK